SDIKYLKEKFTKVDNENMVIESEIVEDKMFKTLTEEIELKAPASKAWSLYGTLKLGKLLVGKLIEAFDVVEGDGGTGTITKVAFKYGTFHHLRINWYQL
nr:bet v I domain-containing protein [Tanacetum cinerariifolium]